MSLASRSRRAGALLACVAALAVLHLPCRVPASPAGQAAAEVDEVTVDGQTAGVITQALKYLAAQQAPDGSWSVKPGPGGYPVAMTGYALMAMMSAGQLPTEGEHRAHVAAGIQYLVDRVGPDGLFQGVERGKYMYSHGIATTALAELYGESPSATLKPKLEQLVAAIVHAQSPVGGWRYTPDARDADISVTVPQVSALRAAKDCGLLVPRATLDSALAYIHRCYNEQIGGFGYQPYSGPGFARTAAAIYSLQVCGAYGDPAVQRGSDYLFAHNDEHQEWWPYGSYYATPAQYMIGGETWRRWYALMRSRLLATVVREGGTAHWDDERSSHLGPVYITAVNVTILALPYHYLPLYQR